LKFSCDLKIVAWQSCEQLGSQISDSHCYLSLVSPLTFLIWCERLQSWQFAYSGYA